MKRLMHIVATPRGAESRTLKVSEAFMEEFRKKYPACDIDRLSLAEEGLPALTVEAVSGKYVLLGGGELSGKLKLAWRAIEGHIERFLLADAYLVSSPMWNFSVPYPLKHYIDIIVQPKYLFRYTPNGVEGLAGGRKMLVVTSRGGDYSAGSPFRAYDLLEPYLRTVFGFVGITDIAFINAQPMDAAGPDVAGSKLDEAISAARKAGSGF